MTKRCASATRRTPLAPRSRSLAVPGRRSCPTLQANPSDRRSADEPPARRSGWGLSHAHDIEDSDQARVNRAYQRFSTRTRLRPGRAAEIHSKRPLSSVSARKSRPRTLCFPLQLRRLSAASGTDQHAVDQDDVAALSDDFLQRALQALGPRGEQVDHFQHPAAHRVAEMWLSPAMSASRWSWRRRASTIVAIRPGGSLRHREWIFFRWPRSRSPTKVKVAVDSCRLDW